MSAPRPRIPPVFWLVVLVLGCRPGAAPVRHAPAPVHASAVVRPT